MAGRFAQTIWENITSTSRTLRNYPPSVQPIHPQLTTTYNSTHQWFTNFISLSSPNIRSPLKAQSLQILLHSMKLWLTLNRMTASPHKSTVTLLISNKCESKIHLHLSLNSSLLPFLKTPTIIGITYNSHMNFSSQTIRLNNSATKKCSAIKLLIHYTYGQLKKSVTL